MSRRFSPTLVSLAFVFLATPAMAQSASAHHKKHTAKAVSTDIAWKQVYSDNTVAVFVDPKGTIKHSDGTYTAHLRWAYTSDQEIGRNENYRVMRETRLIDCKTMGTKPIMANTFDLKGKLISSFNTPDKDMKYLAWTTRKPESSSAKAFAAVCRSLH